jgi:hypothetical protein
MRHFIVLATGMFIIAAGGQAIAGPFTPAGFANTERGAPLVLVQDKPAKDETLKQKVKRVWRNIAGYKFDVNCPINSHRTCAETGKDRNDARSKCIARNPVCWVSDTN